MSELTFGFARARRNVFKAKEYIMKGRAKLREINTEAAGARKRHLQKRPLNERQRVQAERRADRDALRAAHKENPAVRAKRPRVAASFATAALRELAAAEDDEFSDDYDGELVFKDGGEFDGEDDEAAEEVEPPHPCTPFPPTSARLETISDRAAMEECTRLRAELRAYEKAYAARTGELLSSAHISANRPDVAQKYHRYKCLKAALGLK